MITYFDASALIKRYVEEDKSDFVRRRLADGIGATSRLTEVEVASAVARRAREGAFAPAGRDRILATLARDLDVLYVVELSSSVVASARRLVVDHVLRSSDAVQLASGLALANELRRPVAFVAFDDRLLAAARAEGLSVAQ